MIVLASAILIVFAHLLVHDSAIAMPFPFLFPFAAFKLLLFISIILIIPRVTFIILPPSFPYLSVLALTIIIIFSISIISIIIIIIIIITFKVVSRFLLFLSLLSSSSLSALLTTPSAMTLAIAISLLFP